MSELSKNHSEKQEGMCTHGNFSSSCETCVERQKHWAEIATEVDTIKDLTEKPVDEGIKEVVIALRVHDLGTQASCEGHEHVSLFPSVSIQSQAQEKYENDTGYHQLREKNIDSHKGGEQLTTEEFEKWEIIKEELVTARKEAHQKITKLLDEFYKDVSDDSSETQLIINSDVVEFIQPRYAKQFKQEWRNANDAGMPRNEIKQTISPKYVDRLHDAQEEMDRFAEFLKNKYFDS